MKTADLHRPTVHDTSILDSLTLSWLSQHLAEISSSGALKKMDNLPERAPDENVVDTEDGPLKSTDTINRLAYLADLHASGLIDHMEWLDPILETKARLISTFIQLELQLLLGLHDFSYYRRDFAFRKGGIIVWRERPEQMAA